jgi:hypothetical protein
VPRRRRWWVVSPSLGVAGARQVEAFFALHLDRLRGRARLAVAARGGVDPAVLSQGGRAPDPVGHRGAGQGPVVSHDGRCHPVPRILAPAAVARAMGGPAVFPDLTRLVAVHWGVVGAVGRPRPVRARRDVPLADRAALRLGQRLRRGQGAWHAAVRDGHRPGVLRRRMEPPAHGR